MSEHSGGMKEQLSYRNLTPEKPKSSEEAPGASGGIVVVGEQELEKLDRLPVRLAIHVFDSTCSKDSKHSCNCDCQWHCDELI